MLNTVHHAMGEPQRGGTGVCCGETETAGKRNNVVLIGFMGTGKTTVARRIAEKTGYDIKEMDEMIENDMVLKNLFSQYYPNKEYYNSFIGTLKNDYSEYLNQKREEKGYEGEIERIEKEIYDFVEKYKLPETDYGKLIETLKSDLNQKEQLLKGLEEAENELKPSL